jgi:peptidoglycan/LPS O-acetylase OafA/YrhL
VTLAARVRDRDNGFDVLRLAAAAVVLVSHSFVVAGHAEPHVGHWSLGALGVEVFFAISGFLVAKSWLSQPRLSAFAFKRSVRILPALLVTVSACALLFGPLSAAPGYILDNLLATVTGGSARHVALDLPGAFGANADHAVNRSLWTLPIEVRAYMLVALLGLLGLLTRALPAAVLGFFALSIAPGGIVDLPVVGSAIDLLRGADGEASLLVAIFAMAGLAYVWRERVVLRADLAALALVAFVLSLDSPVERIVLLFAIPYLVLFLAYRGPSAARRLTRHADVSYGLYLLAFPVQQVIVRAWDGAAPSPVTVALIALPATYLLATISWYGVERPFLRLKRIAAQPRAGTTVGESARAKRRVGRPLPSAAVAHTARPSE